MMKRLLRIAFALVVALAVSRSAEAQVYQTYYGAPATTYYQPAPTAAYYQPVPVTTCYAPAPTTVYYAPPVATTYYRRPLIGGTISGWRYNYPARTYVYPTQVAYYPAW